MKVHIKIPYCVNKNLGKAYNEAMRNIPQDDWCCLMDYDVMLLTPDAGKILHEYASLATPGDKLPVFTCATNRIHPFSKEQLLLGGISDDANIKSHLHLAETAKGLLYKTTELTGPASGFLMMVSKKTWNHIMFNESNKCLGVDSDYFQRLRASGNKLLRMDGLYVWHTYRLIQGITDKKHLL